ncbi:MAG TPA: HAMP domain-containing sensor histidine kinase [Candidatus Didemnitutus sp.]|nr:HAMP domain-containing sensor histidine kinase [Candidatus Didemnitutus sp.]
MNAPASARASAFRVQLLVAMMVLVVAVAGLALLFAQHNVAETVRQDFERRFAGEIAAVREVQAIRHEAQAERCRVLARKPRIHAALEDDARDLLYPSARDELGDLLAPNPVAGDAADRQLFEARFYRFLDVTGAVIRPPDATLAGIMAPAEEQRLALRGQPRSVESGFFARTVANGTEVDEVIAMPVVSTETHEVIASLVLGFRQLPARMNDETAIRTGWWIDGHLLFTGYPEAMREAAEKVVAPLVPEAGQSTDGTVVRIGDDSFLSFCELLNPHSGYPPAYLVGLYPLADAQARQRALLWEFVGAGLLLVLGAYGIVRVLSARLSRPVAELAEDSEQERAQRKQAEHALGQTSAELQRSARFSADASHQLKTPVTVLRAGLEELLADNQLAPEIREELSTLVHQTFRLTNVIEDLLLLSRLDAGRLQLDLVPVNLTHLLDGLRDDLDALPDAKELLIESDLPPDLNILGERRYTSLILQNLLENARKYNLPGGRIRMAAREDEEWCVLTIGNTGRPIDPDAQVHIFERFHRGAAGENIPGHGLGLNLARELARLHGGDLVLRTSDQEWTEFEIRFRLAPHEIPRAAS